MAGPTKGELERFFHAFEVFMSTSADQQAKHLDGLFTLHDAIRAAGMARPRVGRPAHLREPGKEVREKDDGVGGQSADRLADPGATEVWTHGGVQSEDTSGVCPGDPPERAAEVPGV